MTAAAGDGNLRASATGDLLGELGRLLSRLDPPPAALLDQVRRSFCWRTVDAELAELSFDSALDGHRSLALRSEPDAAAEPRMLGFGAVVDGEHLAIEVEVGVSAAGTSIIGQLWPPGSGTVEVQTPAGPADLVPVDQLGCFVVEPVPPGPVRLSVPHRGRAVHSAWVSYASG